MQFKFAAIVTSVLAASLAQVAADSGDGSPIDDLANSIDSLSSKTHTLITAVKRLNKNTLTTKGYTAIITATKIAVTISILDISPIFGDGSSNDDGGDDGGDDGDSTSQDAVCENLAYLSDSLAGLLAAINSKLSTIAGSSIAPSIQVVLGLLQAASDSLQANILTASAYCDSGDY